MRDSKFFITYVICTHIYFCKLQSEIEVALKVVEFHTEFDPRPQKGQKALDAMKDGKKKSKGLPVV